MSPHQFPSRSLLSALTASLFLLPHAAADSVQWTASGSGSWTDPANWSSNPALPGAGSDVTIHKSVQTVVTLSNSTQSINSLANGDTLLLSNNAVLNVAGSLTNSGLITVQNGGKPNTISAAAFSNTGALNVLANSSLSLNAATWTNTGTFAIDNGVLNLGGNFTTAAIGTISRNAGSLAITGTLDNSNSTLNLANTGNISVQLGTIRNGTITGPANQLSTFGGTLDNVTLANTTLTPITGTIQNNITLQNATINDTDSLSFAGNESINGNGTVLIGGFSMLSCGNNTSITSNIALRSNGTSAILRGYIANNGLISAETPSASFAIQASTLTNNAAIIASNNDALTIMGINNAPVTFSNFGTLHAAGANITIPLPANFSNGTLTGGTWLIDTGSAIHAPIDIQTNAANISLNGSNAAFYNGPSNTASALANLAFNAGNLTLGAGASLQTAANLTNTGTLFIGSASTLTAPSLTLDNGLLEGAGDVNASVLAGAAHHTIAPVNALSLAALTTNANTTLLFNIYGPHASDRLIIPNNLSLNGGTLHFFLPSSPALGYYTLIQSSAPILNAASLPLSPPSAPGIVLTLDTSHDLNALDLHIGFPGDANDDGHVDLSDLSIILNNFGSTTASWSNGNFFNSPTVDLNDLAAVLNNINTSSTGAPASSTPTPEPASLLLTLPTSLLYLRRKRIPKNPLDQSLTKTV